MPFRKNILPDVETQAPRVTSFCIDIAAIEPNLRPDEGTLQAY